MTTISPFLLQLLQASGGSGGGMGGMQSNAPQIPLAQRSTGSNVAPAPQMQRPMVGQQTNPLGGITNLTQNGQKLYNSFGGGNQPQVPGQAGMPANGSVSPTTNAYGMNTGTALPGSWSGTGMSPSMAGMPQGMQQGMQTAPYMQGGNSGVFGSQNVMPTGFTSPGTGAGTQAGQVGYNPLSAASASPAASGGSMGAAAGAGADGTASAAGTGAAADGSSSSWLSQLWDLL